jgi:excisionase family DNA binding protein
MQGPPKFYTTKEAAALLRCTEKTIRRRILAGRLLATKPPHTHRWLIPESELKRLLNGGASQ